MQREWDNQSSFAVIFDLLKTIYKEFDAFSISEVWWLYYLNHYASITGVHLYNKNTAIENNNNRYENFSLVLLFGAGSRLGINSDLRLPELMSSF